MDTLINVVYALAVTWYIITFAYALVHSYAVATQQWGGVRNFEDHCAMFVIALIAPVVVIVNAIKSIWS